MEETKSSLPRLEVLKRKEQFIVNTVGEQKLLDTINTLEKISDELHLNPFELLSITELYRLEKLLPVL